MKTNFTPYVYTALAALVLGGSFFEIGKINNPSIYNERLKEAIKQPDEAFSYLKRQRAKYTNPTNGTIDVAAVAASRNALVATRTNAKVSRAFPQLTWTERGPNDVGGRTRCLLIDKVNPNKLIAAAAGGGLFVSTNAGDTWKVHPQTDTLSSLQGSSLAQSVTGDIYYATGEGYGLPAGALIEGGSALPGDGIFKSTDGGVSFKQLNATRPAANSNSGGWAYIMRVICHPTDNAIVYAGTSGGLKKSVDGGTTWANAPGPVGSSQITDVEILPNGNMIVGTTSNVYFSSNGGTSFSSKWGVTGTGLPGGGVSRFEVAYAPSNPDHVYVIAIDNAFSRLKGVFETTNFGTTFTTIVNGGGTFEPFGTPPPSPTFQGFWGVCMAVNPTNENEMYIGGMQDLYRYTPATQFQSIAYWRGNEALGQEMHSDIHSLHYDANNSNTLYTCTDGGVYRSYNASAPVPSFGEKNDGLNNVQTLMFDVNVLNQIIDGAQDNGTHLTGLEANSKLASRSVNGGDGGICGLSDVFTNVMFGSVSYNSDLSRSVDPYPTFSTFHKSSGAGISFFDKNIDLNQDGVPEDQAGNGAIWSMPMDFKEVKKTPIVNSYGIITLGTLNGLWFCQKSTNAAIVTPSWFNLRPLGNAGNVLNNARFTAVHISRDGKAIYGATSGGQIFRATGLDLFNTDYSYFQNSTNGGDSAWNSNGVVLENIGVNFGGNGIITSMDSDPIDGEDLFVTISGYGSVSGYVRKVSMAKTGIVPLTSTINTSGLPVMPINSVAYVPGYGKNRIVLGTESGVWGSDNAGATWQELNNLDNDYTKWHPRVPVTKVIVKNIQGYTGPVVFTGTHGRGMWCSYTMATKWPLSIDKDAVKSKMNIYPNPVTDQAIIELSSVNNTTSSIQIVGMDGSIVKQLSQTLINGDNIIKVNTQALQPGAYVIIITANGVRNMQTIIKQ